MQSNRGVFLSRRNVDCVNLLIKRSKKLKAAIIRDVVRHVSTKSKQLSDSFIAIVNRLAFVKRWCEHIKLLSLRATADSGGTGDIMFKLL